MLLLLDNFEHLRSAAPAIGNLLEACPGLQALVTSRAALHLDGEREYRVPPLPVPDQHMVVDLTALSRVASVGLFLERAHAARSNFQLTPVNAPAVVRVCVQLEGIPLAIELAAARLRVLSAEQIADRLDDCFNLLTNGEPTRAARHQTLERALDWSFLLLEAPERAVLRRMAVFADGATADAVRHVCADNPADTTDVLDGMARLVDQSLVTIADHGDTPPLPSVGAGSAIRIATLARRRLRRPTRATDTRRSSCRLPSWRSPSCLDRLSSYGSNDWNASYRTCGWPSIGTSSVERPSRRCVSRPRCGSFAKCAATQAKANAG